MSDAILRGGVSQKRPTNRNPSIRVIRAIRGLLFLLLLLPQAASALTPPEAAAPGPDVIIGDLPTLIQAGSDGTQVGLMMATDICNNGNVQVNWFQLPETDHPVIPQNLYRMSGGANNDERFEQIGQSWVKHAFLPLQQNACGFGCIASPDSAHLGVGCSTADSASANASENSLGSRAWVNPYTGIFPSTANNHSGHTHSGITHRIFMEGSELNTMMNPGATYYGEAQLVAPHEYAWCAAHTGECNMYNNVSYRQFAVAGTTSFTFSAVGDTVRMTPALLAWPGATILTIEPAQGIDGKAFLAYKVTQTGPFLWHYEFALYNQNLDRGINFFSVPAGCGIGSAENMGFHAPPNHPGIANDGTVGDAGYSNVPWTQQIVERTAYWYTETFAQNPNANAVRWGTLYNFRFDGGPPSNGTGGIGFFKTNDAITVSVPGPGPECTPTIPPPSPTASPPPPTPTATATPTPSPTPTATPSSTPSPMPCAEPLTENFDSVTAPALPPGWSSSFWVTETTDPDTAPNDAYVNDPTFVSDRPLDTTLIVNSAAATVAFRNNYNLESGGGAFFSGGVLEIASPNFNGGAFTDIIAIGGSFVAGGYNGTIDNTANNPLADRDAWAGNSGGYITTVVNLGPNVVGQTIQLRFRFGSGIGGSGTGGWRIDTMSFSGVCTTFPPPPSPTPSPSSTSTPSSSPSPSSTATPSATPTAYPTPSLAPSPPSYAVNLSTRMRVQTDAGVGIGGFIITGASKFVLIRAIGPSLAGFGVPDTLADPVLELHGQGFPTITNNNWRDTQEQEIQNTGIPPTNDLESAMVVGLVPGSYTAIVRGNANTSGVALVELYDLDQQANSRLANLSTRAFVGTGDNVVIAGLTLGGGTHGDQVVVRGLGPSLTAGGVPGVLADPTLELRDRNGALIYANNDWQDNPVQAAELTAAGLAPANNLEAAMFANLPPDVYTAILAGRNNGTGIGLIEIYDLGPGNF